MYLDALMYILHILYAKLFYIHKLWFYYGLKGFTYICDFTRQGDREMLYVDKMRLCYCDGLYDSRKVINSCFCCIFVILFVSRRDVWMQVNYVNIYINNHNTTKQIAAPKPTDFRLLLRNNVTSVRK